MSEKSFQQGVPPGGLVPASPLDGPVQNTSPEAGSTMSSTETGSETVKPGDVPSTVLTSPLHPIDPPQIGDFWPSARLAVSESGVAYLASEENATAQVMVVLLSQGAASDPAARDRLAGEVDRMDIDTVIARGGLDQDAGRMASKFRSEGENPSGVEGVTQAPWVALAFDGTGRAISEARRILDEVDLARLPQQGSPAGPGYKLHWSDSVAPGLSRVWPLPWPGKRQRGGRLSILASWLLMLLLAALAVLIAILIFSQAPETTSPPPIPTTLDQTGSGSPPPTSGSPPPTSGSPTPLDTQTPTETASGVQGTPTPPSRL